MRIEDYCTLADGALMLRRPIEEFTRFGVTTDHPEMKRQLCALEKLGRTSAPLTILGGSGSGKDMIAQYVHQVSARRDAPFIKTNCAYLPEERMALELFGSGRGVPSGLLSRAEGGSFYIENIDCLSRHLQYRLMDHILAPTHGATRFIACMSDASDFPDASDLDERLHFYFSTATFRILPLRQRPEDILLLCFQQLRRIREEYQIDRRVGPNVMQAMLEYAWPNNIRQLMNAVERMALLSDTTLMDTPALLEAGLVVHRHLGTSMDELVPPRSKSLKEIVQEYELLIIRQYVERCGSLRKAAAALKVSPSVLSRKLMLGQQSEPDGGAEVAAAPEEE